MSIKICQVTDFLPKYHKAWGGAELAAVNIIGLLQSQDCLQSVLSTRPLKTVDELFDFYPVPVLNDYLGKISEIIKLWTFDLVSFIAVIKIFKKIKPDVLHLHNFRTISFSVVEAAKRLRIPVVFSVYDNWCLCPNHTLITKSNKVCKEYHGLSCFSCTYIHKKPSVFFRKPVFNYFLNKIDFFIVLSHTMVELLSDYGIPRKKIVYLPLPLSVGMEKSDLLPGERVEASSILYCGWISPHKGLKVLLQAMPEVVKVIPQARLYVIETGVDQSYKNSILDYIEKHHLKKQVIFLGKKDNEDVHKYLRSSELVVVPEQWGIAWPIFLTEAMFLKKPIVASRIGDISFFVRENVNGYTVDSDNPGMFSEKIIYCLTHRDMMVKFGEQSRNLILEICNNNNIRNRLMEVYNKVI